LSVISLLVTIFTYCREKVTVFCFALKIAGLYLKILLDQNEIMRWMDVITILSLLESKWRRIFRITNSLKLASTIIIFMEQVSNQCEK